MAYKSARNCPQSLVHGSLLSQFFLLFKRKQGLSQNYLFLVINITPPMLLTELNFVLKSYESPLKCNFSVGLVNVHVKHPPEASVQIHQVSPVDSNGQVKNTQSSHTFTYHSSSQSIQHGHTHSGVIYPNQQTYPQYQPVTSKNQLGRCFQETAGMQVRETISVCLP